MENKLYRNVNARTIGGVCAGLADYFNTDVSLVRAIFVFATVAGGCGIMAYIVLWIVIPAQFIYLNGPSVDYRVPQTPPKPFAPVKRQPGTFAIVFGSILVVMGTYCLLDQFDWIPDIQIHRFWPVVFIVIGLALIFNPESRKRAEPAPWEKSDEPAKQDTDNLNTL